MPLPLPRLDDRTYGDLVEQARGLIPSYAPEWTDHNASDPGITLVELFAWLVEMLLYRADQVPPAHRVVFLRLLNGPGWELPQPSPGQSAEELVTQEVRAAVRRLRDLQQAVTEPDYETLAVRAPGVARALAVAGRDLNAGDEAERAEPRSGYVSVVVVPSDPQLLVPYLDAEAVQALEDLLGEVSALLDRYRLLTTRLRVVTPLRAPVWVGALVGRRPDVRAADLEATVAAAVERFLDPLTGGFDGAGWPFGRSVYVSEVVQLLEGLDAVDHVPHLVLESRCMPEVTRCVEAPQEHGEDGELVRLVLEPHHLPIATGIGVTSASAFAPVRVDVGIGRGDMAPAEAQRHTRAAVRALLEPPGLDEHFPPAGEDQRRTITSAALEAALPDLLEPVGLTVMEVTLSGPRVTQSVTGVTTLVTAGDELVDARPRAVFTWSVQ